MRDEISTLLARAGAAIDAPLPWDRLVMMHSSGSLVHADRPADDHLSERGFHFVLLSRSGAPTHYCKCSPARADGRPHRQAEVLAHMRADPSARTFVPWATSVRNERIELHVAPYFHGRTLDHVLVEAPRNERWRLVERALDACAALSGALTSRAEAWRTPGVARLHPAIEEATDDMLAMGVPAPILSGLLGVFRSVDDVERVPQHGDLWAENILCGTTGALCIVDLDHFGAVDVPLFDVLHLLRTLADARPFQGDGPWTRRVLEQGEVGRNTRRILAREAERWALGDRQVGACFLYFACVAALRVRRRGGGERFWGHLRDEIPAVASAIRELGGPEALGAALTAA